MNRILITTLLSLLLAVGCSAAPSDPPQGQRPVRPPLGPVELDSSYSFIRFDTNHLYLPQDSSYMQGFFKKLTRLADTREGHLNVVHIGSSHVQGGTLPHRLRTNLLALFPDLVGPRGMVFPYSVAPKCNNPYDYRVTKSRQLSVTRCVYREPQHPMGLCGIAANASDSPAEIGIRINESDFDWRFDRVILLGESDEGVVPNLRVGTRTLVPSDIDSARHRYLFNLPSLADSLTILLPCDSGQTFSLRGVLLKNKRPGITYHSIGVNGASTADYLKCQYFTNDLRMLQPDLVIFGIGINDASGPNFDPEAYYQRYRQLVDSVRSVNPRCALLFITNNDSYRKTGRRSYAVNQNVFRAREVVYRLADETGGAVWDQFLVMGGLKSIDRWRQAGLAQSDRVHFTRKGYELVADLLFNAIIEQIAPQPPKGGANGTLTTPPSGGRGANTDFNERHPYISY